MKSNSSSDIQRIESLLSQKSLLPLAILGAVQISCDQEGGVMQKITFDHGGGVEVSVSQNI